MFNEIDNGIQYGVHVYGGDSSVRFLHGAALYHPDVPARSLKARASGNDAAGAAPGVKDPEGNWDVRPHPERIIEVAESELAAWAALVDEPGTPATAARMLYPVNIASAAVLDKIAAAPRLGEIEFEWTSGWNETTDRKLGHFESRSDIPTTWQEAILQGPHLTLATPIYQQSNPTMRSMKDYSPIDLESIPETFIPRTNYQVARPLPDYLAAYPKWNNEPSPNYFRLAWRRMADSATVRTLHSAIIPPGPCHIHGVLSGHFEDATDLVVAAGFWSAVPVDFFVKASGASEMNQGIVRRFPHVRNHPLKSHLILRTLRLNCLVRPYAPLWSELYSAAWQQDSWVPDITTADTSRTDLGAVESNWTARTPLRRDADRRQALIEIDAIVAIMLDITAEELLTIYRTQFPVLQKYEREALYDANGRQLPTKLASEYRKNGGLPPSDLTVDGITYEEPIRGVNREHDMQQAHAHFSALPSIS